MERKYDNETALERELTDATVRFFMRKQKDALVKGEKPRRALHGKSLGVAQAEFVIEELPYELRCGIFARPGTYDAVMRFSNGALPKAADILPNVRGAAIKIFDVDCPSQLALENMDTNDKFECDFLMADSPVFFVKDIGFIEAITHKKYGKILSYLPSVLFNIFKATSKVIPTLLQTDFFSQVPHYFGEGDKSRLCKYALLADKDNQKNARPNIFDRDYLRHDLEDRLKENSATYRFCVQFAGPGDDLSDLTRVWQGEYVTLATVKLPQLPADVHIRESEGELLSFNPFRAPYQHQPAGWVGRMRRAVYDAGFKFRRDNSREQSKGAHQPTR